MTEPTITGTTSDGLAYTVVQDRDPLSGEDVSIAQAYAKGEQDARALATADLNPYHDSTPASFHWLRGFIEHCDYPRITDAPEPAVILDVTTQKVLTLNDAALRFLGVPSKDSIIGTPLALWLNPGQHADSTYNADLLAHEACLF